MLWYISVNRPKNNTRSLKASVLGYMLLNQLLEDSNLVEREAAVNFMYIKLTHY